ncbi:MAG: hypothetical protein ACREF6_13075 [Alphaproteobacteria bacterium]
MAVLSRTIAVPKAEAPADAIMGEMDSLHILPLKIIPFRNSVLKSSRLIKNSRLETVVELFRHAEGASGQVAVNDIWGILGVDPEALEIQHDRIMLNKLGGLYSYDVYTLRMALRAFGIEIADNQALKLSPKKSAELGEYMSKFTRPLLSQVYSGMKTEITNLDQLLDMFRAPDKGNALRNLQVMAERLHIGIGDIPKFLEDYGDIFLSLAYFRDCLDTLIPQITELLEDLGEMRKNMQLASDRNLMKTCAYMEERLTDITTSITGRFENFHQNSADMWENVTAESFRAVKDMVASHHMTLGGVLCGLSVKMSIWEEKFGGGRGGLVQRSEFIMSEMRQGIDTIAAIEKSAPSVVSIRK